jgi:hypothetical protein
MKNQSLSLTLPKEIQKHFDLEKVEEKAKEWIFYLKEKEDQVPPEAQNKSFGEEIVKNGYHNRVELIHHFLSGKPCYLRLYRRKWKVKGQKISYSNHYNLHPPGLKCTYEFGDFLKRMPGKERRKFFQIWPNLRHIGEESFSMVSGIKRIFSTKESDRSEI